MSENVTVSLGYTMNMGNFESLRMDIGYTKPVLEGESDKEALDNLYKFVEDEFIEKFKLAVKAKKEVD